MTPTDVPDIRPVILAGDGGLAGDVEVGDPLLVPSADDVSDTPPGLPVRIVGMTDAIPIAGRSGMLIDIEAYTREDFTEGVVPSDSYVLAREGAPDDIVAALADAGVDVDQPLSLAAEQEALGNDAYALSLRLYVVVAVALLLLALAGVAAHLIVGMPGRRQDAASLRVVGVSKRSVLLAGLVELSVMLGVAAGAGFLAGVVAQLVVLDKIRLGTADSRSPDIAVGVDLGVLGGYGAGTAMVLFAVATTVAWASVRRARGAELRESAR